MDYSKVTYVVMMKNGQSFTASGDIISGLLGAGNWGKGVASTGSPSGLSSFHCINWDDVSFICPEVKLREKIEVNKVELDVK